MRILSTVFASVFFLACAAQPVLAQQYSPVPAGDAQYAQCLTYAAALYQGGNDPSPIAGQSKAQAFCTCMWQETPDNFKGNLVVFSETPAGKTTNKTCEKYSNWGD